MNDEELRAFLESATEGDPEPKQQSKPTAPAASDGEAAKAEPSQVPRAATPSADQQSGLSFDELIGLRRQQAVDPDPVPLILPEPRRSSSPDSGVTPLLLPPSMTPAPGAKAAAQNDPQPPTQPLERLDMPSPSRPEEQPAEPGAFASSDFAPIASAPRPAARPVPTAGILPPEQPRSAPPTAPLPQADESSIFGLTPASDSDTRTGDEYEKISVTGGSGGKKFLPWIIVGVGAIIALVASIFIVNSLGSAGDPAPTAAPVTTEAPAPEDTPSSAPSPSDDPESSVPTGDQPPSVEVGSTMLLDVPQWGISADLSSRFGQTSYMIDAENRLVLTSALIDSLPESCAAMRSQWGIVKVDSTYEVLKPAETCADAPEVFDELWGLTAAIVESIRPL
ncbi:hypothetical protein ACR5KS_11595 [Leucobacter sp. W1153]|uniref:hypothetical protein n=1 Tax=Leucobacter sp. W1153 TaxID=3439064 RepID=UPI003F3809D3